MLNISLHAQQENNKMNSNNEQNKVSKKKYIKQTPSIAPKKSNNYVMIDQIPFFFNRGEEEHEIKLYGVSEKSSDIQFSHFKLTVAGLSKEIELSGNSPKLQIINLNNGYKGIIITVLDNKDNSSYHHSILKIEKNKISNIWGADNDKGLDVKYKYQNNFVLLSQVNNKEFPIDISNIKTYLIKEGLYNSKGTSIKQGELHVQPLANFELIDNNGIFYISSTQNLYIINVNYPIAYMNTLLSYNNETNKWVYNNVYVVYTTMQEKQYDYKITMTPTTPKKKMQYY